MTDQAKRYRGGCLCGAVRYCVDGPLRPVVVCHCGQCRRSHGGPAPYTAAVSARLVLTRRAGLRWYASSPGVGRGFCRRCGASLFWRRDGAERTSIAVGSLDGPTGLGTAGHIHVAHGGDWYAVTDGTPQFSESDGGALCGLPVG
jgi:hypothetical protein